MELDLDEFKKMQEEEETKLTKSLSEKEGKDRRRWIARMVAIICLIPIGFMMYYSIIGKIVKAVIAMAVAIILVLPISIWDSRKYANYYKKLEELRMKSLDNTFRKWLGIEEDEFDFTVKLSSIDVFEKEYKKTGKYLRGKVLSEFAFLIVAWLMSASLALVGIANMGARETVISILIYITVNEVFRMDIVKQMFFSGTDYFYGMVCERYKDYICEARLLDAARMKKENEKTHHSVGDKGTLQLQRT